MSPRDDQEGLAELGRRMDRDLEGEGPCPGLSPWKRPCRACGGSGHDSEDGLFCRICRGQGELPVEHQLVFKAD